MIVVADSGSTKTDWRIVDQHRKTIKELKTMGFHPYLNNSDFIYATLNKEFNLFKDDELNEVSDVYYYGAGCSSPEMNNVIETALQKLFVNAKIYVDHDLVGASRALFGDNSGIACILGTGSNSCVWNGTEIVENIPSHGYVFGDEGSGSYLGRELLKMYLNGKMSNAMLEEFENQFNINEQKILRRTYQLPNPNVFLASFAIFYDSYSNPEELAPIVMKGFNEFFELRVLEYENKEGYKNLGFIGSIAYSYQNELKEIAGKHGYTVQLFSKQPIDNLIEYHTKAQVNI